MHDFRSFRICALLLLLALAPAALLARELPHPATWPQEGSDLSPDPAVTWGRLPNGMRYVLLPNATPKDRVSLRLLVSAGSLMEREEERGLAHFLEHMAFNGSREMPSGDLVKYLERLGMAFGADTNARTSFDSTVYLLELPSNDQDLIDRSLLVLRQTADQLTIPAPELERERGVILSEKRLRATAAYRSMLANLEFLFPDSLIPQRLPIGLDSVIETAPRGALAAFYQTWYRPDRITLVAVGAIEPAAFAGLIAKHFASLAAHGPSQPSPDLGEIRRRGLEARLHDDPEARTTVSLQTVRPVTELQDTRARRLREGALYLAHSILTRRLTTLALQPEAPFQSAAVQSDELLDFAHVGYFVVNCHADQWEGALRVAETELRRALNYGFTEAELEEQKKSLLSHFEEQARSAATRESQELANEVVDTLVQGRVFTHPQDDYGQAREALAQTTVEEVWHAFKDQWGNGDPFIFVSGAVKLDDAPAAIARVYRVSQAHAVAPPADNAVTPFAYASFGEPSTVAERSRFEPMEVTQIRFGNNVRVNLKPTQFEANSVLVAVRVGGGRLELPLDKPGLKQLADAAFVAGGLEKHSLDELNRITAGRNVDVNFDVDDDAFTLSGKTTPQDLELELQLLAAYVAAPGYRPEALRKFRDGLANLYQNLDRTPNGVLQQKVARFLRGGDPRFGYPARDVLASRTLEELREVLREPLGRGYLEVSLVGDFDLEKAIAAVNATFGSLPARVAHKPKFAAARELHFPRERTLATFTYETTDPKALAGAYWPTTDFSSISDVRRLYVLAKVLGGRILDRARNAQGLTYTAQGDHAPSQTFPGYGVLYGLVDAPPAKAVALAEEIRQIGGDLYANGVTQDELERARKPVVNELKRMLSSNGYLVAAVVSGSQELPQKLERATTSVRELESLTVEDVNAVARKYLAPEAALPIVIVPERHAKQPEAGRRRSPLAGATATAQ